MSSIIDAMVVVKDNDLRQKVYEKLIPIFEDHDCDVLEECCGEDPAYDEALALAGYGDDEYMGEE